jgi:hypothetical protein
MENKLIILYCDNKVAINITNNLVQYDKTKLVKINQQFIKDKLDKNIMCMSFVGTKEQITYIFIKRLSVADFFNVIDEMSMINIYALFCGEC